MSELSTWVTETDNDSIDGACHALCISIYIFTLAHSEDNSSSHVNCCDHNVDRGGYLQGHGNNAATTTHQRYVRCLNDDGAHSTQVRLSVSGNAKLYQH